MLNDTEGFTEMAMGSEQPAQAPQASSGYVNNLVISFYMESVQDKEATVQEGRPIFKEQEYIQIMTPGDQNSVIRRPVRVGHTPKHDNMKYPTQYQAFKQKREQKHEGTVLSEWPLISRSQVEELKYFNIFTVEQLASVADNQAQKFMGLVKLKQQAQAYLDASKGSADSSQIQSELSKQKEENEALKAQMEEMKETLKSLKAQQEKGAEADESDTYDEEAEETDVRPTRSRRKRANKSE